MVVDSVSGSTSSGATPEGRSKITSLRPNEAGIVQPAGFPGLPPGWLTEWETFAHDRESGPQLFGMIHHREPWNGHRALLVVHGLGEHGGRYMHLPHYLETEVDAVYCLDLRGHGRSEGIRGHVGRFDDFTDDVVLALHRLDERLRERFGRSEIHLLGHSLGGHIVLRSLLLHPDLPLASATVCAPLLGVKTKIPFQKKLAALALSRIWGSIQLSTGLDPSALSHDPEVAEAYKTDRLVHDKMTPRCYGENEAAMEDTLRRHTGIHHPLLVIVPLQDSIVDSSKSLRFFEALKLEDKALASYAGFYHEPMNETGKEQVFGTIRGWLAGHHRVFQGGFQGMPKP
jgi:alpha-beta hydrolase superfamily lysophospholipase